MKIKSTALFGIAGIALSTTITGYAAAEPAGTPAFRALAGVGSDTTEEVLNGLSQVILDGAGQKVIASYDAKGGGTIQTKSDAKCAMLRPNGSGAGRTALLKALNPADPTFGCVDFSRSSSLNVAASAVSLTYIPFAVDALTYATAATSTVPKNFTRAELTAVYKCEVPSIPNPLLPQASSGTRATWLGFLGLTETTKGACVRDVKGTTPVQEHDGRILTEATDIVPFSVSQHIAQGNGAQTDQRGTSVLNSVDGVAPVTGGVLNTAFGLKRSVYNVVPTFRLGSAPYATTFVGAQSAVCRQTAVIQRFGFGIDPDCGSVVSRSASDGTQAEPTAAPTASPTARPSASPTALPTASPTATATATAGPTSKAAPPAARAGTGLRLSPGSATVRKRAVVNLSVVLLTTGNRPVSGATVEYLVRAPKAKGYTVSKRVKTNKAGVATVAYRPTTGFTWYVRYNPAGTANDSRTTFIGTVRVR